MGHCERCANAKPKSACHCDCGGRFHAKNRYNHDQYERTLNMALGGELAQAMRELQDKPFLCTCMSKQHTQRIFRIAQFEGYPHDGGLADETGEKWWLYVTCPHCGYQWSFWKLQNRLANLEDEGHEIKEVASI